MCGTVCAAAGAAAGLAGMCLQRYGYAGEDTSTGGTKPNFVVIVADDAGWHDVGYHGSEVRTPNIDRLAREGVELDNFYVYPTCSPTRASLLTGKAPSRFGILGPIAMRSRQTLPKDAPTLAEVLRTQGYDTAITGKWHLGLRPEAGPNEYGFRHAYGYLHGQIDQYTHIYKNGDRSWHRNGKFIDEKGHATDLITNEAVRFIREIRDETKPFFLYVPYSVPHYPLQEEERWTGPYRGVIGNESRRLFAASMTHMDAAIGRLIEVLEEEGLAGSTLVVFMSDNGGQKNWNPTFEYGGKFPPNDRLGDNSPLRGWKGGLYEGGIRVPALMYWPGKLEPGRIHAPVIVWDIFPTLARLAGADSSSLASCEGMDVWDVVKGEKPASERIFYWRTPKQAAVRKGAWKLIRRENPSNEGSSELYNIAEDPCEKRDRARDFPARAAELRRELERWMKADR